MRYLQEALYLAIMALLVSLTMEAGTIIASQWILK